MKSVIFSGCQSNPLASYLKSLGILRILAEQSRTSAVRGYWKGNAFVIDSNLDSSGIVDFFLKEYRPTPIMAPWNGGSGFYPKDNSTALDKIAASKSDRFAPYREAITGARSVIASLCLKEKPEKEDKEKLLRRCRNSFSETGLEWLDSAFILTGDGAKYPPLLGTGGNDGRLEFTNNFMQRLVEVIAPESGKATEEAAGLLPHALFGSPTRGLQDDPIGQFSPAAGGGANASSGFDSKGIVNPWDFILALEGAIMFAAAAVKRLEGTSPGQLVYPFCVQASGAGYGSAAGSDEKDARCEIWMPLWSAPSSLQEIRALLSEGRAWIGKRTAKNGVDFVRAIGALGVDRGIGEFQRYGFHVRNGLAYFATPLQRVRVQRNKITSDLLAPCDAWLAQFLSKAKAETAPGSVQRAARQLESAIFAQASVQDRSPLVAQEILISLGQCERAIANSEKWRAESFIRPIPPLSWEWIAAADDGSSSEYRLAASLASLSTWFQKEYMPFRRHLEPVKVMHGEKAWCAWDDAMRNDVVWHEGQIVDVLHEVMRRRLLLTKSAGMDSWPDNARLTAWPSDIAAFIDNRIDEERFAQLLWGLCVVDFTARPATSTASSTPGDQLDPPAFYAQLKLCFASRLPEEKKIPVEPVIFNLAASGDGDRASSQALRRLHGSNIPINHFHIPIAGDAAMRCAAALLFPLWESQLGKVGQIIADEFFRKSASTY